MAANPYPLNDVPHELSDGTMVVAYADGETVACAALEFFEVERRMAVIPLPKIVTLSRPRLNTFR